MRLRRIAWWTAAVAGSLAAAAVAIVLSFDLDSYRAEVAAAVAEATGRPVTVEGRLSLAPSLRPKLVAEGVALGNPPGFSRPDMLRIGRLEAAAQLWPLLQGRIEIDRLELRHVDLLLERGPDGRGNWVLEGQPGGGSSASPRIGEVVVSDSVLGWRQADRTRSLRIGRLQARLDQGEVAATFEGDAEGTPIRLDGRFLAPPRREGDSGSAVAARGLRFKAGDVEGEAELTLVLAPERPRLDGAVSLALLDLDRLSGPSPPADDGRLIPDVSLAPPPLDIVDLALAVSVGRLVAAGRTADQVSGRLRLDAGELRLNELSASLAGGALTGSAEAREKGDGLAAALRFELRRAELAALLPDGPLAGRVDLTADLKGQGSSLRRLAATLDGDVRLLGRDGVIAGRGLELAAGDLLRLLAPWTERDGDTKVRCMLFAATIRNGRAAVDALAIDADRVLVTGEGTIDLGRERLDLRLAPRPKEPSLLSLATPVFLRGTFAAPSVAPDEAALARSAAGALFGNLALPGVGFLLPFLSAGAEDHPCAETLAKPSGGQPRQKEGGVGGFLRGLGRSIDRTLGTGR